MDKIKKLREETSAGVMAAKKALEEAGGDLNKAKDILYKKGVAKAASKSERQTSAGLIEAYIHGGGKSGVLIELNCETDFVARTDVFKKLAHNLAMQIAAMNPSSVEELLSQEFIKDTARTVEEEIKSVIAATGENIVVRRFSYYALNDTH
ncbi:translation elongation factor Ts [candidate division CPR3 bacterium 4484_211]|uniref:Elongation factor Ts n=1 Tax=candidate division CPR3 bacterium 4484_211 TaxID=1968527 RepID=A0A1W9NYJ5_UNCC3|nr:MAG: translation elongation factor Ts [candidate division CPR3 bacterium 4484_211]